MFEDRIAAGVSLASLLVNYHGVKDVIVLGLPRGGVVVAAEVAKKLQVPLDVICPRKIRAPHNSEYAIGAVTEKGEPILDQEAIESLSISPEYLNKEIESQRLQSARRLALFRKGLPPRHLEGKTVILVDDGLATGSTMKAAIRGVRREGAKKLVVAVPVSPIDTLQEIQYQVDEVFCLETPRFFHAIGQFYARFDQVEDEEVLKVLGR